MYIVNHYKINALLYKEIRFNKSSVPGKVSTISIKNLETKYNGLCAYTKQKISLRK